MVMLMPNYATNHPDIYINGYPPFIWPHKFWYWHRCPRYNSMDYSRLRDVQDLIQPKTKTAQLAQA